MVAGGGTVWNSWHALQPPNWRLRLSGKQACSPCSSKAPGSVHGETHCLSLSAIRNRAALQPPLPSQFMPEKVVTEDGRGASQQ